MSDEAERDLELLDTIKSGFGLRSDSAVAGFLGMSRAAIHNVRHGKRRLGLAQRLKILDKIGYLHLQGLVERISPGPLAELIRQSAVTRAGARGVKRVAAAEGLSEDAYLLETAKDCLGYDTDEDLAQLLGVGRNVISMVRSGRTTIGPKPRLRLLHAVAPFDIERMEEALTSTDALIAVLEEWADSRT